MFNKSRKGMKWKRRGSKAIAYVLSTALLAGGMGISSGSVVQAEEVSGGDAVTFDNTVSSSNLRPSTFALYNANTVDYTQFTENETLATWKFGEDVTSANPYTDVNGYGFHDVEFKTAAKGWEGGIYYPREGTEQGGVSYITDNSDYLAIGSKVWTETEDTGYGVYTYENTSAFSMQLDPADYQISVTLVNPTSSAYTAYLEAEDITKASGIEVPAGGSKTTTYTAVLLDGVLDLKFLVASSATSESEAQLQTAYVSQVVVTRLATGAAATKPTIYIASDSTVQTYETNYYPQTGWGQTLALFFGGEVEERECEDCDFSQSQTYEAENVIVENRALGGRSSKSYVEEGKLDDILEDIQPGDYLFIQWGHNDATAARPNRYVDPSDFGNWIQCYVDGARQRGAIPVLVTPVARYSYITNDDGTLNTFVGNFESYGDVMRDMAAAQDIPLIDLTARSVELCNEFGIEGAKSLFLHVAAGDYPEGAYAGGATDSTHLQYYGAYKFAQCVAEGIMENSSSELADLKTKVVLNIPSTVPAAVTNLTNTKVGASSVSMQWDEAEGAELYYIYRQVLEEGKTIDDVDFSNAAKYSVTPNAKYTDSSCEAGTTYVYAIRAFNEKGLGEISNKIEVKTKEAGYKFDMNFGGSPTMEGWTGVEYDMAYDATLGYGWTKLPGGGRYRENNGNEDSSAMADDFSLGAGEFAVDLPNGDYEVTVYAADLMAGLSTIKPSYTAEGLSLGGISCKQALGSCTNTVRIEDGQLNLGVGGSGYLNGFTITALLLAPSGFQYSELTLDEATAKATFLIGFNPVEDAVSYNIYGKNSSDKKYSLVKSFTVAEYAADDLACRAMTGDIGEQYSYYMTCVTADGTESASSNVIELSLIQEGPKAAAPQNLKCLSPTLGDTELQNYVKLQWEAVEGAIKYIIYRSDRAEDEKGFVAFEKVGETKSLTYTDEDGITTNVPYYYKVAALTKTGVGELSEVCVTPVVGSLVPGGREYYSDRAVVAINLAGSDGAEVNVSATDSEGNELTSGVYVSWRSFEADFDGSNNLTTTFDVYRNGSQIASDITFTNLVDEGGSAGDTYLVVGSNDSSIGLHAKETAVWANKYMEFNLYCPDDETMPDGSSCDFSANDMSVGDLDGNGDLELLVKWYPSNAKDNSGYGYTGKTFIDAYDVDFSTGAASLLWRIDMGVNIRSGAHYTQFQVWDYDGDGKAELAVKTADGTTSYRSTDGTESGLVETCYVGACNSDALPTGTVSAQNDYRNSNGFILEGPEYFSIFNGEDGSKAAEDVEYLPERGSVDAWGDAYGNRVDRFLSGTAYLDGSTPFAVFTRGYYTRTCMTAYYMKDTDGDGIGDAIGVYWEFDTNEAGTQYEAQGNHGLSINDIDGDGKDEIIFGGLTVDHDGTVKYSTNLGHGDAMHVSDWVSWNSGLEIMAVHEHDDAAYHVEIHDAETGEIIMGYYTGKDTGRGVAADIDPTWEGGEWWSIASPTYESNDEPAWDSTNGEVYSTWSTMENLIKLADSTPASNASIFWDGDLLSEIQDHTFNSGAYMPTGVVIYKWNYEKDQQEKLLYSQEIWSNNGTKGNVGLIADVLGDWREEIITRASADKNKVRIYSTTIQTDYVVPCLLENLAYREGVAWENVGYNQPANLSYLLSDGLVTAKIGNVDTGADYVQFDFAKANDSNHYGHEILGYEIYRAEGNGEFELHDTFRFDDGANKGKKSFMSEEKSALTDVLIIQKPEFTVPDLVEGTPIPSGKTVAALLPTEVDVLDQDGNPKKAIVTWDVSEVDINTVGTYKVIAKVEGWDEPFEKTVKVVPNELSGYAPMDAVAVVVGTELTGLPEKVAVTYTNTTSEEIAVTWDTSVVDTNAIGQYTVYGTLQTAVSGLNEKPSITVTVIADYIVSIANVYYEVELNATNIATNMPTTATATWASGKTSKVNVTWGDISGVKTDTIGTYEVAGAAEGMNVIASVSVIYPAVWRFDFGTEANMGKAPAGWTEVTVNNNGGKKNISTFGSVYSVAQGYGFTTDSTMDGRIELLDMEGVLEPSVYQDFMLPGGNTFVVDLPNGKYYVQMGGGSTSGGSTAQATIEGTDLAVKTGKGEWKLGSVEVEVTDRQLTVVFPLGTWRVNSLVIREIERAAAQVEIVTPDAVEVVKGMAAQLPENVQVVLATGDLKVVDVTWDLNTLDINTVGTYTLNGTLAEDIDGLTTQPTITVNVVEDYVTATDMVYMEAEVGKDITTMPTSVNATYASGAIKSETVTWDLSAVNKDKVGTYEVEGTIAGSDVKAKASVYVAYQVVARYDFKIESSASNTATDWIPVVVNNNRGTKTFTTLGSAYTADQKYGFANGDASCQGRDENYTYAGLIPQAVYKDFAIPDGQQFLVDVPNGTYYVEIIGGSYYKSTVKATVEGSYKTVSNTAGTYAIGTWESVKVTDGQLTIDFTSGATSRVDGIIVRQIELAPGYSGLNDMEVVVGSKDSLPLTVTVVKSDQTTVEVGVTWDTSSIDVNTPGTYIVTGTLTQSIEGLTEQPKITVKVIEDYVVSVEKAYEEVEIGNDVASAMPTTVSATYYTGVKKDVAVTWDTSKVDAYVSSIYTVTGTVDGYEGTVEACVYVAYPTLYKFDIGGTDTNNASKVGPTMDDFTAITSSTDAYETSGTYGFTQATLDTSGVAFRYNAGSTTTWNEPYSKEYAAVFDDCFYGAGTADFKVKVPNGKYVVEVLVGQAGWSCKNLIFIQDMDTRVDRFTAKNTALVSKATVEVTDGELTIRSKADTGSTAAVISGIIIREVVEVQRDTIFYKFDFGGVDQKYTNKTGPCMTGFTEINSSSPSYETSGTYGFTDTTLASGGQFRYINGYTSTFDDTTYDSSYLDAYEDGYMTPNAGTAEFVVKVPNGTYDVDVLAYHGGSSMKTKIFIEDTTTQAGRLATQKIGFVASKTVTITDGTINIVWVGDGSNYPGMVSAVIIKEADSTVTASTTTVKNTVLLSGAPTIQLKTLSAEEKSTLEATEDASGYTYTDKEDVKSNTTYRYKVAAIVKEQPKVAGEEVIDPTPTPNPEPTPTPDVDPTPTPDDDSDNDDADDDDSDDADDDSASGSSKEEKQEAAATPKKPGKSEKKPAVNNQKKYTSEVKGTIPEAVLTKDVMAKTGCKSIAELVSYMKTMLVTNELTAKILPGATVDNTSVVDITIMISLDGGKTWKPATEENFPVEGVDVVIPYPEGIDKNTHNFMVGHLITMACNGMIPGDMEYFNPEKTEEGLKIHIMSASPFIVSWEAIAAEKPLETPTEKNEQAAPEKAPEKEIPVETVTVEAADSNNGLLIALIIILVICAGAAAGIYVYKKKKEEA